MPSEKEGKDMISTAENLFGTSAIMELERLGVWLQDRGAGARHPGKGAQSGG